MKQFFASLTRETKKGNVRYYRIELFPTLFGEYLLKREYGNIAYKSPTGIKLDYFKNFDSAYKRFCIILKQKKRKGYK